MTWSWKNASGFLEKSLVNTPSTADEKVGFLKSPPAFAHI